MLEKQLSISLKITLIIAAIIVIHGVSNIAGNLGLISDLFILLGLIQSVRFITNSEVRQEIIYSFNNFINIKDIQLFIKSVTAFIKDEELPNIENNKFEEFLSNLDIYSTEDYELEEETIKEEDKLDNTPLESLN